MRSKEVEEAIKRIKRELTDEDKREYMSSWFAEDLDTVLSYIEELEKRDKAVLVHFDKEGNPIEYINKQVIRDEIKELEEDIEESKRMIKNATEEDEKKWWQEELIKCATGKVYLESIIGE